MNGVIAKTYVRLCPALSADIPLVGKSGRPEISAHVCCRLRSNRVGYILATQVAESRAERRKREPRNSRRGYSLRRAEGMGFEPTTPCGASDFESDRWPIRLPSSVASTRRAFGLRDGEGQLKIYSAPGLLTSMGFEPAAGVAAGIFCRFCRQWKHKLRLAKVGQRPTVAQVVSTLAPTANQSPQKNSNDSR
jgi:hypothetical protein